MGSERFIVLLSRCRQNLKFGNCFADYVKTKSARRTIIFLFQPLISLGPIYTVRFLSHATSLRQAFDTTYDCRSVLKHVLKCYDIFLTFTSIVSHVVGLS